MLFMYSFHTIESQIGVLGNEMGNKKVKINIIK